MNYPFLKKLGLLSFFLISMLIWYVYNIYSSYYARTDNAYIGANTVQIAPAITGKVARVYIKNNQYVKQNQILFEIDPEPFQLKVNQAKAQLAVNEADSRNNFLIKNRILTLTTKKYLSAQEGDTATDNYNMSIAKVEQAKANLAQALLDIRYTVIRAPASGRIANLNLQTGDSVLAHQPLFILINTAEFWVDANFKETELENIHPGQTAIVTTDLYPHHPFTGIVESISGGAGAVFSLLPPQNATGNWVKITQRIPVRVKIIGSTLNYPLRIGISSTVTIQLRSKKYKLG